MKRASKAVGLVLITSAALLLGCGGHGDTVAGDFDEDFDGGSSTTRPYNSSRTNHVYHSGFSGSSGRSFSSSSSSSGVSRGGFGSSSHSSSSS